MNKRILLAEDNYLSSGLAKIALSKYYVDSVNNGRDAVKLFLDNSYDIILLDLQMPHLNGYEAAKEIRRIEMKQERDNPTVILAVTAGAFEDVSEKCAEAGFNGIFHKPYDAEIMAERIEGLLEKSRQPL